MNESPDFYLYGGEGSRLLDAVRACWKFGSLQSQHGKNILLVRITDPASPGMLSADALTDMIGLATRSTLFEAGEFGGDGYSAAVLWEVGEKEKGRYVALRSLGIVTIWKDRATLVRHNPSVKIPD